MPVCNRTEGSIAEQTLPCGKGLQIAESSDKVSCVGSDSKT
jgi:hypothetical protein